MPTISQWLALDKVGKVFRIMKHNGGITKSLVKLFRNDDLKIGTLVGTDKYGNRYYENNEYFHGRNRWVEYADHVWLDYNASQISPEWHGWMHYSTDLPPTIKPPVEKRWMTNHIENLTGTDRQYVPYSTTRQKVQAWVPPGHGKKESGDNTFG